VVGLGFIVYPPSPWVLVWVWGGGGGGWGWVLGFGLFLLVFSCFG